MNPLTARRSRQAHPFKDRLYSNLGPCLRVALVAGSRLLILAALVLGVAATAALLVFREIDPPGSTVMALQRLEGIEIDQRWVPLHAISPNLIRAVIMSEDNQFCRHFGVDIAELRRAIRRAERDDDDVRGASTISMQTTKNLLLWPDKSYMRKAIEIPLTLVMEQIWPKRRIMEVYLNIAEWGPGIFGAEAAARYHFGKPASALSRREAALLAVALPNPLTRVASRPSPSLRRVAALIERRVRVMGTRAACVLNE
ncbi:MAG: monofunctional biosynthetic peptidoglycan transglycosylase [Hyphomicrobiaceae bacterium]